MALQIIPHRGRGSSTRYGKFLKRQQLPGVFQSSCASKWSPKATSLERAGHKDGLFSKTHPEHHNPAQSTLQKTNQGQKPQKKRGMRRERNEMMEQAIGCISARLGQDSTTPLFHTLKKIKQELQNRNIVSGHKKAASTFELVRAGVEEWVVKRRRRSSSVWEKWFLGATSVIHILGCQSAARKKKIEGATGAPPSAFFPRQHQHSKHDGFATPPPSSPTRSPSPLADHPRHKISTCCFTLNSLLFFSVIDHFSKASRTKPKKKKKNRERGVEVSSKANYQEVLAQTLNE